MAEGFTNLYLEAANSDAQDELADFLASIGVDDFDSQILDDTDLRSISFDHNGTYNEKKLTSRLKKLAADFPELFIRGRHYDEYGTEIYWLIENGKLKKYVHDVDVESGKIVKAYNHWHAGLGSLWDGHFEKDDIKRISERFGFYDEHGKAVKGEVENLAKIVTSTDSFFHKGIKAPYASHKFDNDAKVLQSYAAIMASKSEFAPEDKSIRFNRTFVVKDAFDSDVIGFVWCWMHEAREVFLVITWHGELAVRASIVINHESLTTDEIIYISVFDEFIKKEILGGKQWVYAGQEQVVYPPCMEYVWNDSERDRDRYGDQNIVLQFMNVRMCRGANGNFRVEEDGAELFEIEDAEFATEIDALGDEKFIGDRATGGDSNNSGIWVHIQGQFNAAKIVGKVLGIEVLHGKTGKCMYKRHDPVSESWPVPSAP